MQMEICSIKGKRWFYFDYFWIGEKGQNCMASENCNSFVEKEHWEKSFVCGQDFLSLDYI